MLWELQETVVWPKSTEAVKDQTVSERTPAAFHPRCTCPTELSEKSHFVVLASYVVKRKPQIIWVCYINANYVAFTCLFTVAKYNNWTR